MYFNLNKSLNVKVNILVAYRYVYKTMQLLKFVHCGTRTSYNRREAPNDLTQEKKS